MLVYGLGQAFIPELCQGKSGSMPCLTSTWSQIYVGLMHISSTHCSSLSLHLSSALHSLPFPFHCPLGYSLSLKYCAKTKNFEGCSQMRNEILTSCISRKIVIILFLRYSQAQTSVSIAERSSLKPSMINLVRPRRRRIR